MEMMNSNEQLVNYILQQRRQSVSESQIRDTLLRTGWDQASIDRAFAYMQQLGQQSSGGFQSPQLPDVGSTPTLPDALPPTLSRATSKTRPARNWRRLVLAIVGVVLIGSLISGGVMLVANTLSKSSNKQTPSVHVSTDPARKNALGTTGDELVAYYQANNTYPTLTGLNNKDFATSKSGFVSKAHYDPSWQKSNKDCTDQSGNPTFVSDRANGCFAYRVTARNGADCNATSTPCTRAVLTANLENGKPYILVLDQTSKTVQQ